MRVTIEHREKPTLIGNKSFFVDVTVLFSEMEKAVIRERQMGKHFIQVGSDIPRNTGLDDYGLPAGILRIISRVGFIAALISLVLHVPDLVRAEWIVFFLLVGAGPLAYRKYAEWQYNTSNVFRALELNHLIHNPEFTVYAADALAAAQAEQSIVKQLEELKQRLLAVAPGLSEKQVYKL